MSRGFKTNTIEDTELVYSILREHYPSKQIEIEFNDNTKEYTLRLTNEEFKQDPEVPIDVNIKVVYGDSCTPDTPLLLRNPNNDLIHIETIESIFDESKKVENPGFKMFDTTIRLEKEYSTTDYQVWTDIGWQNIKKVIRHKCDKKIYKIVTHTGCVKVTEDHSLLNESKEILKPTECKIGTSLLTSYCNEFNENPNTISKDRAFIYGFFYGDGSASRYECKSGLSYNWYLNNPDLNVVIKLKGLLEKEYPDSDPIICDTGVYKLSVNNQKSFVEEYRSLFYDSNKYKKVPTEILNSSNEVIQSFFSGYKLTSDFSEDKEKIGCKGQIGSAGLYYLMRKLGIDNKEKQRKTNQIKKIEIQDYTNDFVYDLETECGRYQAGVGDIIIKNTDSVFLRFQYNRDNFNLNRKDTFNLATICGNNLTNDIFNRKPIELEFEKVFHPFILLTKKRYIANKYENPKDPFKLKCVDAKGIALTRRDYCQMVKNCYKQVIDIILNDVSGNSDSAIQNSINLYKQYIDKISNYEIDVNELVVSAMLASSYKTRPVHVQLAERLKLRKEEVQIGSRIPYIYIESTDKKQQKSELGEDPKYAMQNNLKYNRMCYLEQLAKPLLGFYKITLKDYPDLLDDIITYTNNTLIKCGGKALRPSDFKIED